MTVAQVKLWGTPIAAVVVDSASDIATFEYEPAFLASGIEVAPLMMPLSAGTYRFPQLAKESFRGLPGMLSDSLPDKFGNAVLDAWLAAQGGGTTLNAVERLCYTGSRGMGALEFEPVVGKHAKQSTQLRVDALVEIASEVLRSRQSLEASFESEEKEHALREILRVGASAGGARAKAVIAWNPSTNEVRSGQVRAPAGFEYWLMKFDGVAENRDKELADPRGYGSVEYAYSLMAKACGIRMSACHLFEENGRRHFMTKRFDRSDGGQKLHMQTLGAIAHYDFNMAGAYSYEQAINVIKQLGMGMNDIEQQFRRMAFNVVARNQDDHVKNIAFLMDKSGTWSLSPAYDITYSYNPRGSWTSQHQMTINSKRDGFTLEDFKEFGRTVSMARGRAEQILHEVTAVVRCWIDFAEQAGVAPRFIKNIGATLRTDIV